MTVGIMRDAAVRDAMRRDFFRVIVEEVASSKSEIEWPTAGGRARDLVSLEKKRLIYFTL
jgi:hypothetical protein